jgi:hypothetical protein
VLSHTPAVALARSNALPDVGTSSSYDSSPCIVNSSSTAPVAMVTVRPTIAPVTRLWPPMVAASPVLRAGARPRGHACRDPLTVVMGPKAYPSYRENAAVIVVWLYTLSAEICKATGTATMKTRTEHVCGHELREHVCGGHWAHQVCTCGGSATCDTYKLWGVYIRERAVETHALARDER